MPSEMLDCANPWEVSLGRRAVGQTESFAILTLASGSPLLMTYFFHKRLHLSLADHNMGEIPCQGFDLLSKVGQS